MCFLQLVYIFAGLLYATSGLPPQPKDAFCNNNLKITGGQKVSIMEAPYVVAIHEFDEEGQLKVVGAGSIIHGLFILTSASNIDGDTTKNRSILLGTDNLLNDGVFLDVEQVLCHEDYDANSLANDICLLKLTSSVPFAWFVKVSLPYQDLELKEGTLVTVTGWGAIENSYDPIEDDLRQVNVPLLSQKCCYDNYLEFDDNQICAGSQDHDFCEGDNGGPMTYYGVQIGVISGAGECGQSPGVYTRVTSYLDWIESTIVNNL